MNSFTAIINQLLQLLTQFAHLVLGFILTIEVWLRAQLASFGVPHQMQTIILIAVAVVLVLASLRLFGGLIRIAVILFLLLLALNILLPVLQQ